MLNLFKVENKKKERNTWATSSASIVNSEHILHFTVIIAEFEQINASWAWETIVSEKKFVFSNCEKYTILWASKICSAVLSLFTHVR